MIGQVQTAQLPKIVGTFGNWNQWAGSRYGTGAFSAKSDGGSSGFRSSGTDDRTGITMDTTKTGASTDHLGNNVFATNGEVRSANIRCNWIIKAM